MQSRTCALFEASFELHKPYADPFNDVEVDVMFSRDGQTWRVPAFWWGGQTWTVRFAAPRPGDYRYQVETTDTADPDLGSGQRSVSIGPYEGPNALLRHGPLKVSANGRYFEHVDGTPFFWLGDTCWTGLSSRLDEAGFRALVADRKHKGFTVMQLVAGLVPFEELVPVDPGCCNEGGPVWEANFERINPNYFDAADRRICHLLEAGIVPALVGAWRSALRQAGLAKIKQHWRYLIARYGCYPVIWVAGGELIDPPPGVTENLPKAFRSAVVPGWTDIVRYIRATDPYHHPLTAHEVSPPGDHPITDERLTDFDLLQSGHYGPLSLGYSVAQIGQHYARTSITKPVVQGEIGYEQLGGTHFEDFQRSAFWLSMLNGAAGHTYGADGIFEAYAADQPLHRLRWSFLSWREGMDLPGSRQLGYAAELLRRYKWWQFEPRPDWVIPRGTTLFAPQVRISGFERPAWDVTDQDPYISPEEEARFKPAAPVGTFRRPYAAGIVGEVRFIYIPGRGLMPPDAPTILGLEPGVRYQAYLWQPSLGIPFDLGEVERPSPGEVIFKDESVKPASSAWHDVTNGNPEAANSEALRIHTSVAALDGVVQVDALGGASAALVLRYQDAGNYVAAEYSPTHRALRIVERRNGVDSRPRGQISVGAIGEKIQLRAEVRGNKAIASLSHGTQILTTPIVDIENTSGTQIGLLAAGAQSQRFANFAVRSSPKLSGAPRRQQSLHDARGAHRGELSGACHPLVSMPSGWDEFGLDKHILLDAYRPERLPASGDWVLVLDATEAPLMASAQRG